MSGPSFSRRAFLAASTAAGAAVGLSSEAVARSVAPVVSKDGDAAGLDGAPPPGHEGQTWGCPWPRGTRYSEAGYRLVGKDDAPVAVQSWPLAWWPDGSIKWTGHAIPASSALADGLRLLPGKPVEVASPIAVREHDGDIEITNGPVRWQIPTSGDAIIRSAARGGRNVLDTVQLVARSVAAVDDEGEGVGSRTSYTAHIDKVMVEQGGPIRAVVKLDGRHQAKGEAWLPFSIRMYFYAGSASVRIVHSMIYDGDPAKAFICGLGLTGGVPMGDAPYDRHLRFAGEQGGLWGEAVQPLTGLRRDPGEAFRQNQVAGTAVPPLSQMSAAVRDTLQHVPQWGDFTLSQRTADGFAITKRTGPGHGWIAVDSAGRAPGLGYVGGVSGGVAFAMTDFWQRCPTRLDIRNAASDRANFTIWYHAPDAPPMDMRFYHGEMGMTDFVKQNEGMDITYEDYQPGWGDPHGIARTTEFRLWALPATPSRDRLVDMAEGVAVPPRLMTPSARIHQTAMFGIWSRPDRSTPLLAKIEDRAKRELDFYVGQVNQRRWYGFWNYGDVMHTYDSDRHVWRYDIGGFAWDNSELSSDLWLWYGFLRTGRADIFRMAEAMTRHTSEVDVYHIGRFAGFGTRHGVQHWGDSSKQPRVSNALYKRVYYYLTADERVGDLMHDLIHSGQTLKNVDIGRKVNARAPGSKPPGGTSAVQAKEPLPEGQVFMQFGTTWAALCAAWYTEWERTRDTQWRDRIVAGMESIAAMPHQWFTGGSPCELATGRFVDPPDAVSISHLNGVFGIWELTAELLELLDVPKYREAWLDYCQCYNAPEAEFRAKTGAAGKGRALTQAHSRFTAYAAVERHDPALAKRAWREFFGPGDREGRDQYRVSHRVTGDAVLKPVDEIGGVSTNDAAQWGISASANEALIKDQLG
ncbi:MAG: exo-rhamnogalacturonan lyase family protein [Sphingomonas sp.]